MSDEGDVKQLLVMAEIWPYVLEWLDSRGLKVIQMPPALLGEDDLETYTIAPKEWKGMVV